MLLSLQEIRERMVTDLYVLGKEQAEVRGSDAPVSSILFNLPVADVLSYSLS